MGNNKKSAGFWFLTICLSLIVILTIYGIIIKGEIVETYFFQFAVVFALSPALFKEIPALAKIKTLKPIMIILSISMIAMGFYSSM
tara:strand:+ start:1438 stop:1695 length:258 start_codon:yes stop_codon:yes gene_type:complete